jgi:uncharacterized membrane protein
MKKSKSSEVLAKYIANCIILLSAILMTGIVIFAAKGVWWMIKNF